MLDSFGDGSFGDGDEGSGNFGSTGGGGGGSNGTFFNSGAASNGGTIGATSTFLAILSTDSKTDPLGGVITATTYIGVTIGKGGSLLKLDGTVTNLKTISGATLTVAGLATVFTNKGMEEGLDINGYLNTVSLTPNLDGSVSESVGHADPRNGNFSMFNINFKPSKLEIEVSIVAASATLLWPILGPELAPFLGEEGATIFEKLLPKLIKLPPPI